jgi:hypothetical protein
LLLLVLDLMLLQQLAVALPALLAGSMPAAAAAI